MRSRTTLALILILITASIATACSVPVFRYALEHWHPDAYVAYVLHDAPLTKEQKQQLETLTPVSANGTPAVNLAIKQVDLNAENGPVLQSVIDNAQAQSFPWIVVQTPPKSGPSQTIWESSFTAENASTILDSPVRKEINQRLLKDDSVVWIFLESGIKEVDEPKFELLNKELTRLESKLKLPEIEEEDLGDLSVDPEALKVSFSSLRLSRDNPEEKLLIEMLLHVEPDLREVQYMTQPMIFPVFGRGRALYSIVGDGIVPDVIEEAATFLTGACQCTVKAQNPGVDLIMHLDWDKNVVPTETLEESLPPLAGFTGFGLSDNDQAMELETAANTALDPPSEVSQEEADLASAATTDSSDTKPKEMKSSTSMGMNTLIVLVFLVIAVAVASAFLAPRAN